MKAMKATLTLICKASLWWGLAWQVPLAQAATPDDASIARGAYLARAGDCIACHTSPGGKAFAGGLAMKTPLGTIYSTNITPDPQTGIGAWSEQDFERALRHGVSKDGHNLYPAMPYPSYGKVSDADVAAMYAYFMRGVPAVRQANRARDINFPLNMRWPLKLWNMAFGETKPYRAQLSQSAEWNRGAYLTQGLGHCGACHTPRGVGFQEKGLDDSSSLYLAGAELDGWFASNLRGDAGAGLGHWSREALTSFLGRGANGHASAYGPMTEVVNHSTQYLSERDLASIAVYLSSLRPSALAAAPTLSAAAQPAGARIYRTYCLQCHGADGSGHAPLLAPLAGNPTVREPRGSLSLINVTLNGTPDLVIAGVPQPYPMPAFGKLLDDQQVADVLTYIRGSWNNGAPPVSALSVAQLRKQTGVQPQH